MDEEKKKNGKVKKKTAVATYVLFFINITLILIAIAFSWIYSRNLEKEQEKSELDAFCSTVESMKQVSDNYLRMELGYAKDWAQYINQGNMTIEEALDYINKSNHREDRYAHIVDMDTLEGYSSYGQKESNIVTCYQSFENQTDQTYQLFLDIMKKMFETDSTQDDVENDVNILGKYRADDTQTNVISVGTRVTLNSSNGTRKDYLLLCVIPIESIRKIWVFPVEYKAAEVGIITRTGAYVIPSKSMKSLSFSEFILGYNFVNDYGKVKELLEQLSDTQRGVMEYKDSKGQMCYWYYSSFGEESTLDIMGYIPVKKLNVHEANWFIVIMICSVFFILALMDGIYVTHINRKLRETAKMAEEASQAKSQFLSTMSHDIRTPMNGIIGMTNIAKAHVDDPQYVKECLNKVSLTSDHLLTLINDILDISKVESGNMTLNPAVFSIEQSIEKLIDIVQVQIEEKKLRFETQIELPWIYLIADELRMNQIFINLLTNSIKYTAAGGKIQMSVKEKMLEDGRIRLTYCVTDNGSGMSEEFQRNMYTMFTRESDSRIGKIQGTGLGLAIVKQMVDLMGGTIQCESEVDKGTAFTVIIDLEQGTEKEYEKRYGKVEDRSDHFENLKVLVAEDNDLNWEITSEMLDSMGITCDRAENGKKCIEMLEASRKEPYDLVFMDIQMPVMNGKEAARQIRQSPNSYMRNVTIIAMTADAFAEDVQECAAVGMNGHIAKPIEVKKVLEALRQVSQRKKKKESDEGIE